MTFFQLNSEMARFFIKIAQKETMKHPPIRHFHKYTKLAIMTLM